MCLVRFLFFSFFAFFFFSIGLELLDIGYYGDMDAVVFRLNAREGI